MKNFFQFLQEASTSIAIIQAKRLGLKTNGHGDWYDKSGEFAAKTENGRLTFYNKRQILGAKDPKQTDKEKRLSFTSVKESKELGIDDILSIPKDKGTLTITFGRFNPPTIGHEKLLNIVSESSDNGDYAIIPSRSHDKNKNPLDPNTKVLIMKKMFPEHKEKIINDPKNRTIFDVLKNIHLEGYKNIRIVSGSDRTSEFEKLVNSYNGKLYKFENIEIISSGERNSDSNDNISSISSSKQRKAVAEGDFETFKKGVPSSLTESQTKNLYKILRYSMDIGDSPYNLWEIAPKFDWKALRENYISSNLYNIGELVENLNTGLIGEIIRRGTNYLICVTEDGIMFKSWIKDVSPFYKKNLHKEQKNTNISGVNADKRLVGTDSYTKYTKKMTPGSEWGKQFINKYRKSNYNFQ